MYSLANHRAWVPFGLVIAAALLGGSAAQADPILWYNGDFDGRDAFLNATNLASPFPPGTGTLYNAFIYDDFIVPAGQTWNVTGLFANVQQNLMTLSSTATWQIRSGVSAGNGGTLIASGDGAATETATGGVVIDPTLTAYLVSEKIPTVVLTPGTYWLTLAPDIPSPFLFANAVYVSTTNGANAIGMPPGNDGNSFFSQFGTSGALPPSATYNFTPTSDPSLEGPGTWDYSLGVNGTFTTTPPPPPPAVPEPSTVLTWVLGLCGLSVAAGRRFRRRRAALAN